MPQQQHAHAGTLRYLFFGLPQRVRLQSQALDALLVLIVPFTRIARILALDIIIIIIFQAQGVEQVASA